MILIRAAITSVGVPLFSCHSRWINIIPYQSAVLIRGLLKKKKKTSVTFYDKKKKKWSWMLQKKYIWLHFLTGLDCTFASEQLGSSPRTRMHANVWHLRLITFQKKLISSHPPNEHSRPIFRFTLSPTDSLFFLTCRNSEGVRLRFPPPAHQFDTTALLWLLSVTDPAEATGIWSRRRVACMLVKYSCTEQKPLDHPYFNRLRGAGWGS